MGIMPLAPLAASEIDLTRYAQDLDAALARHTPCVVATADADGVVDIGLKGSLMVFDRDHLAYLERTHGRHLENLKQNPHVAVFYFNREASVPMLRLFGTAQLLETGELRDEIRDRTIAPEREKDPDNRGVGVLVRVDRVSAPRLELRRDRPPNQPG